MSPLWQLKFLANMPSSHIAIVNQFQGPNNSILLREASIGAVVAEAVALIREGTVDMMVVGATGSRIHPIKMLQAIQQGKQGEVASQQGPDPTPSCPFDRNRAGAVLGEGAGTLVLESLENAEKRGATVYAEIVGAYAGIGPESEKPGEKIRLALEHAIRKTLEQGECVPDSVGHINAHGLSGRVGDIAEANAIHSVFGSRKNPIPTTTVKGHFGNLGAGSGAVELIAGILALRNERLFPILNHRETDPDCPVAAVKEGTDISSGDSFVKLSYNAQGQASAILVAKK